jgi:hypothetical protein
VTAREKAGATYFCVRTHVVRGGQPWVTQPTDLSADALLMSGWPERWDETAARRFVLDNAPRYALYVRDGYRARRAHEPDLEPMPLYKHDCYFCRNDDRHDQEEHDAQVEAERVRMWGREEGDE